jgi:alkanesulfonate monooxygenase SsuD/methylene tetrahydromethanopterin reductase-like flavin-dependent oxidoreductase (luciferase family)
VKAAEAAERCGVSTLWAAEHVVLFDRQDSRYPYAESGEFPLPGGADWLDPFITLTFAAAVTKTIRLATGICLVPEHNPVVLAKEVASLDRLSKGSDGQRRNLQRWGFRSSGVRSGRVSTSK